jgi:hypothetical protein
MTMHAVVGSVSVHDRDTAVKELQQQVVPMVSGAPGFVAGYWIALANGQGRSVVVFDSESSAQAAAGQMQQTPRGAVTIDSVEVGEVVANA